MKSNRKQILISSLVMLMVATMALTTTTYAWFTTGSEGTVGDFEFTADAASGILLSVDAETWKSAITSADIAAEVDKTDTTAQAGSKFTTQSTGFAALSSAGTVTDGVMALYKTSPDGEKLKAEAETGNTYYAFNLYINNEGSEAKSVKLSSVSVTAGDTDKKTQLAARVAFIDQGNVAKTSTAATVKANVISKALESGTALILEPNSYTHTSYATTYLKAKAEKLTYYGIKAAGSYSLVNGFIPDTETAGVAEVTTFDDTKTIVAELAADAITKLTVYVWVEGQDIDCNNDVASGQVKVNFKLTAVDK